MTDLYEYDTPDGVNLLIQWLKTLAETRSDRPTGSTLPFIMVNGLGGPEDGLTERGLYSIHSFGADKSAARNLSKTVHRRMKLLAGPYAGQSPVTMNGVEYWVDNVVVVESPHEVEYIDSTLPKKIYRWNATYRVDLRHVLVS